MSDIFISLAYWEGIDFYGYSVCCGTPQAIEIFLRNNVYGSGSELDLAEEKAQQKLLPKVKELVDKLCGSTKPSLCGDIELSCLVFPTTQHFKG